MHHLSVFRIYFVTNAALADNPAGLSGITLTNADHRRKNSDKRSPSKRLQYF
jgi:hypothetical protein